MIVSSVTQRQITCQCGETENLSIVEYVFGSRIYCNTCGGDVTEYSGASDD